MFSPCHCQYYLAFPQALITSLLLLLLLTYVLTHLLTYLLTPWSRVLLEELTGSQFVKKFPAFYWTRRFITVLASARHRSLFWASWRTTPFRLSATAYSIYSQLPSILVAIPPSATWGRAMPWLQGHSHFSWVYTEVQSKWRNNRHTFLTLMKLATSNGSDVTRISICVIARPGKKSCKYYTDFFMKLIQWKPHFSRVCSRDMTAGWRDCLMIQEFLSFKEFCSCSATYKQPQTCARPDFLL